MRERIADMRTEFGAQRTTCACNVCVTNCRHMPGFLIPADLDRMIPPTLADTRAILRWAEENLLASPGALVRIKSTGQVVRVPTLVPATKADGSCMHLTADGLCNIHAVAPFGCAFFDCGRDERPGLSAAGIVAVYQTHMTGKLYATIWQHLDASGKRQHSPEVLRARMRTTTNRKDKRK